VAVNNPVPAKVIFCSMWTIRCLDNDRVTADLKRHLERRSVRACDSVTGVSSSSCGANLVTPIIWAPCNAIGANIHTIRNYSRFHISS
jgi:hypothetical protein